MKQIRWSMLVCLCMAASCLGWSAESDAEKKAAAQAWKEAKKQWYRLGQSRDPFERAVAVDTLAGFDNEDAAEILAGLIREDRSDLVALKARDLLHTMKGDDALKEALSQTRKKALTDSRELMLLSAIAGMGTPRVLPVLFKLVKSRDDRQVLIGLEGFGALRQYDPKIVKVCRKLLFSKRTLYALRLEACRALAQIPHKDCVEQLVRATVIPGRIEEVATRGLMLQTGQALDMNPTAWSDWWKKNEKTFEVDAAKVGHRSLADVKIHPRDQYDFYGIPIYGKRVLFVIDKSGSMAQGEYPRRIDGVKTELTRLIRSLGPDMEFNVIFFSHTIMPWRGWSLQPATQKNKTNAIAYVQSISPRGATYTDTVMDAALKRMADQTYLETIFLLTDGGPFRQGFLDLEDVRQDIRKSNRFHNVRINTIGCFTGARTQEDAKQEEGKADGKDGRDKAAIRLRNVEPTREELSDFLRQISHDNDGQFREVVGAAEGGQEAK